MKTIIATTALVLALGAGAAHATGDCRGKNNCSGNVTQGQAQGQAQGQLQTQISQQNVDASTPQFTYGAFANISSMANDRCGRVVVGIPFSAHTCNVIMEAETLYEFTQLRYGIAKAEEVAMRHIAENDRTMRTTLRRAGIIK